MQKPLCRSVALGGRFRGRKVESVNGERSRLGLARRSLSSAGRGLAPRGVEELSFEVVDGIASVGGRVFR